MAWHIALNRLRNKHLAEPAINITMRAVSILSRFILTLYIAKYTALEEVGVYGLTLGLSGILPSLVGLGINHFTSREIVGLPLFEAGCLLRDRLLLSSFALCIASILVTTGVVLMRGSFSFIDVLVWVIAVLETFALDLHMHLIGAGKPMQANIIVFVRSAAWVFPTIILGLLAPRFRSLETIFLFWIGGHAVAWLTLGWFLRSWPIRKILREPVNVDRLLSRIRGAWLIYINDIGIASTSYLDRYIITFFLGLAMAGLFSFYWSLANALQTLVVTGIIQFALPKLVLTYRNQSLIAWKTLLKRELLKVFTISVTLGIFMFFASLYLIKVLSLHEIGDSWPLFTLILFGTVVRLSADVINYGLYSAGRDAALACINISGIVFSAAATTIGILYWNVYGVGVATLMTQVFLLSARYTVLRFFVNKSTISA